MVKVSGLEVIDILKWNRLLWKITVCTKIKVRENEYQSELVYCDESEADEFVFNGRRIEVVQNGKCINYIGIGDKRDDESYFLTLYPIDLLKLSLDVKFICVLDEEIL